jgi:transcriptional/translational regulatory protein YebC/TACO1
MELALESGAEDVQADGEDWVVFTAQDQLFAVSAALHARNIHPKSQQLIYLPSTTITIDDPSTAKTLVKLYDALDDYDDTQNVHANFEIADEIMSAVS